MGASRLSRLVGSPAITGVEYRTQAWRGMSSQITRHQPYYAKSLMKKPVLAICKNNFSKGVFCQKLNTHLIKMVNKHQKVGQKSEAALIFMDDTVVSRL